MAAAPPGTSLAPGINSTTFAQTAIMAWFQPHARSIGGIVAQVTIDEQATDDLQITEHPVEQGAPIADHAFKRPSTVTIRAGWSRQWAFDLSAETGVYGQLLAWQAALLPFNVMTGKRNYTNMLIERLQVVTDQHTEYALMATITCREVIIVNTSTQMVAGQSNSPDQQSNPSQTAQPNQNGPQQPTQTGYVDEPSQPSPSGYVDEPSQPSGTPSGPPSQPGSVDEPSGVAASTPAASAVQNQMFHDSTLMPNNPPVPDYIAPPYGSATLNPGVD